MVSYRVFLSYKPSQWLKDYKLNIEDLIIIEMNNPK